MNEWQTLTLADVCTVITDGAHQSPKTVSRGKPMASVKDLTRFGVDLTSARHIATEDFEALVKQGCKPHVGDVLIAKDGNSALDTVCTVDHPLDAVLLSSVAILRPDPKCLDSVFLKFYLSSPETIDYLKSNFISGAAIPRVVLRDFKRAEIRLPSLDVQRRIAGVLQSIDSKIDLNRRVNQTLEAMAQAIFQSWFVEFDPVKAKIAAKQEGRDPLRAAMTAVSGKADAELDALPPEQYEQLAATAALFPDEMEESEVGEVPKGWSVGTLSNFASFQNGYAFKTKDWTDSGHPVVKIGNVKPGIIDLSGCSLVAHETVNGLDRFALKKGDLLVGMTGYVGETGLVPALYSVAYLNQRVGRISTVNGVSDIGYPFCLVRDPAYKAYAESKAHGSAQANVSGKDLMDYQAVVPDAGVLKIFNAQVAKIINALLSYHEENQSLAALRDTLLPRLLSGELLVADAMAEAVA
jgi:type I restriction enzyme S subunit